MKARGAKQPTDKGGPGIPIAGADLRQHRARTGPCKCNTGAQKQPANNIGHGQQRLGRQFHYAQPLQHGQHNQPCHPRQKHAEHQEGTKLELANDDRRFKAPHFFQE